MLRQVYAPHMSIHMDNVDVQEDLRLLWPVIRKTSPSTQPSLLFATGLSASTRPALATLQDANDPDYRDNQSRNQRACMDRHPEYWRNYRKAYPEYVKRNLAPDIKVAVRLDEINQAPPTITCCHGWTSASRVTTLSIITALNSRVIASRDWAIFTAWLHARASGGQHEQGASVQRTEYDFARTHLDTEYARAKRTGDVCYIQKKM